MEESMYQMIMNAQKQKCEVFSFCNSCKNLQCKYFRRYQEVPTEYKYSVETLIPTILFGEVIKLY